MGAFFRLDSHLMLYFIISNSTGNCNKIHPVRSQVVFPLYYCFYLFQNSGDSLKEQTEKTNKVNSFLKRKIKWNSKQNISKGEEGMDIISLKK